ncbi:GNAT family N-acetyltransferase [Mucilaginibacter sp. SP1R1]|uniref:GNAT family N-acetyltransferase n=1 Tax=Mucilaginibacter sp. SP1R1 TaxID=2723091 RepID=UPI00160A2DB6
MRVLAFVAKQNSRQLGVGKLLISASEQWALKQGITTVLINSGNRDDRQAAHAFYQKQDWLYY